MTKHWMTSIGVWVVIAAAVHNAAAQSAGFRIEADVFVEGTKEPVQQTLSLFSGGVGYDISRDDDGEVTMIDPVRDRIILLNDTHKLQTETKISDLRKLIEAARQQAATTDLAAYVHEATKVQVSTKKVSVGGELMLYEATLQHPKDVAMVDEYRQFADASKYLNSFQGGPPFARLALNAAVAEQQAIPEEIVLKVASGNREIVYKSRLHSTWLLSKEDESKIDDIGRKLADYQRVSWTDYPRLTRVAKVAAKPQNGGQ